MGAVILNRVKDKKFPDSVYGVCFQPGAFDAVSDGQYYMEPDKSSINAAKAAIAAGILLMVRYTIGILRQRPVNGSGPGPS